MLGPVKAKETWHWAAFGKHPVARDYFLVGRETPLINAFSGWIQAGYQYLIDQHGRCPEYYSYRFWAKGIQKKQILIGLLKGSSDRIGRRYPLMIAGTGELKGWEKSWDLLPFACENLWTRLEYISTRPFKDVETLREDLDQLSPVPPLWKDFEAEREELKEKRKWTPGEDSLSPAIRRMAEKAKASANQEEIFFSLERGYFDDPFSSVGYWHQALKSNRKRLPNAVFIGGFSGSPKMAVYGKPLVPGDFGRLCFDEDSSL